MNVIGTHLCDPIISGMTRWQLTVYVDAIADSGRKYMSMQQTQHLSVKNDLAKANFLVQQTTSKIGNHTRLIHILLQMMTTRLYIHTVRLYITGRFK